MLVLDPVPGLFVPWTVRTVDSPGYEQSKMRIVRELWTLVNFVTGRRSPLVSTAHHSADLFLTVTSNGTFYLGVMEQQCVEQYADTFKHSFGCVIDRAALAIKYGQLCAFIDSAADRFKLLTGSVQVVSINYTVLKPFSYSGICTHSSSSSSSSRN